jgi:phosphate transport system substrate-binding protein
MFNKSFIKTISLIMLLAFVFSVPVHAAGTIKIDGSSTVFPITEGIAEEFQQAFPGNKVTVGISGTGGGFKKFCRGEIDISDASRPIQTAEIDVCKDNAVQFIELPVAFDGLAVVVNPKNTWVDSITPAELKKIWEPAAQGKIMKWNEIRPNWPDKPIKLFGPGTDSGTFDYFTEIINKKAKASRGDYTASEDDNVLVQGVATDPYAMGYFGMAYLEHNKDRIKAVPVNGILPTYDNVLTAKYQPLARPIFIYVNVKSLEKPEVQKFVEFYLKNGAAISKEVGYVALPAKAYELTLAKLNSKRIGTVFAGKSKPGVTIEEILTKEKI